MAAAVAHTHTHTLTHTHTQQRTRMVLVVVAVVGWRLSELVDLLLRLLLKNARDVWCMRVNRAQRLRAGRHTALAHR